MRRSMKKRHWAGLGLVWLCVLAAVTDVQSASRRVKNCLQPTISGRCFGYVPSFAYNPLKRVCEPFVYGGCGGNDNRYATRASCAYNCRDV